MIYLVLRWLIYRTVEQVDELISTLNVRGERESKLLDNLKGMKHELVRRIEGRQKKRINIDQVLVTDRAIVYACTPPSVTCVLF